MGDHLGIGKAIEKLMDPITDLVKRVAGPAADEVGLTLQDSIKVWRAARQYKLFEKMNGTISNAGFVPNPIALKVLLPALDYASVEDNEDLHTIWANLLANAADPRQISPVSPAFPLILKELSSRDARFLHVLFINTIGVIAVSHEKREVEDFDYSERNLIEIYAGNGLTRVPNFTELTIADYQANREEIGQDLREFKLTFELARRHGIIRESIYPRRLEAWQREQVYNRGEMLSFDLNKRYSFSHIGSSFMRACQPPSAKA